MADAATPRRRPFKWGQAFLGIAVFLSFIAAGWYLTSPYFQEWVRAKLVSELETVTGGRVELGSFHWRLSHLDFQATDLTIHGLEQPGEVPYMHFDRLNVELKIISFLGAQLGFRSITAEHPVFHIVAYPKGTTNQPVPKVAQPSTQESMRELFDMAVGRLDVRNGEFIWNDRNIPLDFAASDVEARMVYTSKRTYDGKVHIGKLDTKFEQFRPFSSIADAQFSFTPTQLQFSSLHWSSGNSQMQGSGAIKDFNAPRFELNYDGSFDLKELATIARARGVRRGTLQLKGSGTYASTAGQFSSTGTMLAKNVDWDAPGLRFPNAELSGDYDLNNERFRLARALAHAFGGSARGELEIVNWTAPPPNSRLQVDRKKLQRGNGTFRVLDVPLASVAPLFSSRTLPLDRMNLASLASGTVQTTWEGSPSDMVVDLALTALPPATVAPAQLPITGQMQGTYFARRQDLQISQLNVHTRATQLNAGGDAGNYTANLRINVNTADLTEFKPALAAIGGARELPVNLAGHATFQGTLTGSLKRPQIAGHLQATNFDVILPPGRTLAAAGGAPSAPATGKHLHWDTGSADLQYSYTSFAAQHGSLHHDKTQVGFDIAAELRDGAFVADSPIHVRLDLSNAELADVQALAGFDYPVSGTIDLALQLGGTKAEPQGTGNFLLSHAVLFGQPITSMRSDVRFANGEAQLSNMRLVESTAQVTGNATYNLHTTAFQFNLAGKNFELARIEKLQTARLSTAGELDFTLQGSGTRERPIFNAGVHLRQLVLNGEPVGEFNFEAITHGADMQLTGRSNFEHSQLGIDGTVHLRGDWPAVLTLRLDRLDVDPFLRAYLHGRVTGHSAVVGTLAFHGPLKQPRYWNVVGDLSDFSADLENITTHNDGPIHFVVADRVLTLDRLRLVGEGTDITAGGTAQLFGNYDMNMHADGRVNLRLIDTLNPDFRAAGFLNIRIGVTGSFYKPELNGQLDINQGALAYVDVPSGLSDVNGTLVFTQDRLEVQSLTAKAGGGTVSLGGYVNYRRTVNFHITAVGQDMRLRYPPGMSATANTNLRLTGTLSNAILAGDITVTRFGVSPDFDFATYLVRAKESITAPNPKSLMNNLHLDVHIVTTPELQVQTSIARASGDADLRLRGTAAHPALLGRVNILEGQVSFNGTKFILSRGDITFTNPVQIQPVLDLEATTRMRDYDISIGFHGPLEKLSTTYRSDPPLTTQDIIALLAFGRTQQDTALTPQNVPAFDQAASNAILNQALTSASNNRVQKLFGVSRVKIDPQADVTANNPNSPRLTIEQQVADNITLTYVTYVSQTSQQIIQAEYSLNRYVSLVAIRDQDGVVSFEVRIRQRKK